MTREIIDDGSLLVNTFAGGKEKGECVQFTINGQGVTDWEGFLGSYTTMTRKGAILFLARALNLLIEQERADEINPPWWQQGD